MLTVVLVGLLFVAAGFAPATAVCIGLAASLSSTAIVLKMLLEAGRMESAIGRLSLAILLGQDLAAILFLVTLPLLAGGTSGINLLQTGKPCCCSAVFTGFPGTCCNRYCTEFSKPVRRSYFA